MSSNKKKEVVILGGGISGLSLAYFLKKRMKERIQITLLEKKEKVGGWVQTRDLNDFLIERGPRGFRGEGSQDTLELVSELNLEKSLLVASQEAKRRFLYESGKLQAMPSSFVELLRSPFLKIFLQALFKDLFSKKMKTREDLSVADFFTRHFGAKFTDIFVDALVLGIYAGDKEVLSMKACFPKVFEMGTKSRSLVLGLLKEKKAPSSLYSFKKGMQELSDGLESALKGHIKKGVHLKSIQFLQEKIVLDLEKEKMEADIVCSALPADELSFYLKEDALKMAALLASIPYQSIYVVTLCFECKVLRRKGFGYLIPSKEKEEALGVIWDSLIFPSQDKKGERITVMIREESLDPLETALITLKKHLTILEKPVSVSIEKACIPQYRVNHLVKVQNIEEKCAELSPHFYLLGNAFYGVSLNACVIQSKKIAEKIEHKLYH